MSKDNPDKKFYSVGTSYTGMNEINLTKVKLALEQVKYKVTLPEEIQAKAKHALDKMLRIK